MNAQEIFDKVAAHLLAQGIRSELRSGEAQPRCLYRGPGGTCCAVGVLIGDGLALTGDRLCLSVWALANRAGSPQWMRDHVLLLGKLQNVHDLKPPETWPIALRIVAEEHGLEVNFDG